jgi:hypothetical protein
MSAVRGSGRQPDDAARPIAWRALGCCGLIPVLLTSSWLIAGAVQSTAYNPIRQTVSVLAGHAGTHRWIVTVALIAVGPCYFAAAAALRFLRPTARIGLVVSGAASIGVAVCPEPVVGSTTQHMAFTSVGAASIAVWPLLTAQRESQASILTSTPVAVATTTFFLVMLGWLVVEAQIGTAVGLVERLDSSIQLAWPFAVAVSARNAMRTDTASIRYARDGY